MKRALTCDSSQLLRQSAGKTVWHHLHYSYRVLLIKEEYIIKIINKVLFKTKIKTFICTNIITYEQVLAVHAKIFKLQDYSIWYHNGAIYESYQL